VALTTLNNVKAWLSVTTPNDDFLLQRLMNQVSGATLNYLGRPSITRQTYTELRDGVGNYRLVLRNWPVVSISSLTVGTQAIPAATTMASSGYTLATWDGTSAGLPQEITLRGYQFHRGRTNIQIVYIAGYCVLAQPATVPASSPYTLTITPSGGSWAQDDGMTYANGTPFVAVTGTPTTGQYAVSPDGNGNAVYTFAAGDSGASILLNYSFTPADLEQAVIEWIGERYRYKDRIGQSSKSLGGSETAAYSLKGVPDYISVVLDGYKKFLPL
jgi:hypothetical protein